MTDILNRRCAERAVMCGCNAGAEEMTCEDLDNRRYPPSIKLAQVG